MRSRFALFLSPFGTWRVWPPIATVVSQKADGAGHWRRRFALQWLFVQLEVRLPDKPADALPDKTRAKS